MFNPPLTDKILHKIDVKIRGLRARCMRSQLNNIDFSIISNNCWGGVAYEYYGLPKQSPTVGTYFFSEDYIRFLANFEDCLNREIEIIRAEESVHARELIAKGEKDVPVGRLRDDVELIFLHYKNPFLAKEKWMRRVKRINKDNLIFKFSYMNGCTEEHLKLFSEMGLPGRKFVFVRTREEASEYPCAVYYPGFESYPQIENDTFYWKKYFDVTAFLNGEGIKSNTK